MKIRRFYYIFSTLLILFVFNTASFGFIFTDYKNDTIVREITDEFAIDSSIIIDMDFSTRNPSLLPTNSDIFEIYTWDKELIKRVFIIKVDPIDSDEANNFIKYLKFGSLQPAKKTIYLNLDCGVNLIHADRKKWIVKMADGKKFTMKAYNIKICLYIPKKNELILKSNLSKISLGDLTNKASLNLRSVRLKANNINELGLKAYNSEVQINNISRAIIQADHCEMNSTYIDYAKIVSSGYSTYTLTEVGDLNIIDSKEDDFTIRNLYNIKCIKSVFTNYNINTLHQSLDIHAQNGDIFIDDLNNSFSEVNIYNSFSIIKIGSVNVSNLLLNTNTKLTEYYFSNEINTIDEKKELGYKIGRYYKGSDSASRTINIDCVQCEINLK